MTKQRKHNSLLIISDSGMCQKDGKAYAFGPVVMEVRFFLEMFDTITWIGGEQDLNPSFYSLDSDRISIQPIPAVEATGVQHKLGVLFQYPKMTSLIKKAIQAHEYIHVRAPSHPALIAMQLAKRYSKKRFWFKYAGSWVDPASYMYSLQRKILQRMPANCVVTVNGSWPDQASNILAFENPCLTQAHRETGKQILANRMRHIKSTFDICFVGGLIPGKGILALAEAWMAFEHPKKGRLHIVGTGVLKEQAAGITGKDRDVIWHGTRPKEEVHNLYARCEAIVLPTRTEGFPKVIGEAMNYGCIPIVSDVSCIGQYIETGKNGFLLPKVDAETIRQNLIDCMNLEQGTREAYQELNYILAGKFTYSYYMQRVTNELFPGLQELKPD